MPTTNNKHTAPASIAVADTTTSAPNPGQTPNTPQVTGIGDSKRSYSNAVSHGLLIFTIIYAVASVLQLYVDNLPYVGIDPAGTTMSPLVVGRPIEAVLAVKPIGKGPSYHANLQSIVALDYPRTKIIWSKLNKNTYEGSELIPGSAYPTPIHGNFPISAELLNEFATGHKIVIIGIQIDYTDWFTIPHRQRICYVSIQQENRLGLCKNPEAVE
jgi:hypothetical protein